MECLSELDLGSSGYFEARGFAMRTRKERLPVHGAFDLTYRCNYKCVHCYGGPGLGPAQSVDGELATAQVVDLLSQMAEAGCLVLVLSGGEPLLRDDFGEIYVAARRLGLIVTVFSNASLITEEHLGMFAEYPPHQVEVSFYGATEAVYEKVTGVPGSYRRARQGLDRLLEAGVRVGMKTMILRDNVDEVAAIDALAESLGVGFRLDPLVTARLDGDCAPLAHRVEPERAVEVELGVERRRSDLLRFVERMQPYAAEKPETDGRVYHCGAGVSNFHIDPWGILRPCLVSREFAYNATASGFAEAWRAATEAVGQATWDGVGGCSGCSKMLLCGYCPGTFALEQASPSHPPEYVCLLGESRRKVVDRVQSEVECVNATR